MTETEKDSKIKELKLAVSSLKESINEYEKLHIKHGEEMLELIDSMILKVNTEGL